MSESEMYAPAVSDWANDWDHYDSAWAADPYPIWDDMRARCPMAHTGRYNEGTWLPLRYEQLAAMVADPQTFSNQHDGLAVGGTSKRVRMPPIHNDPPEHAEFRRVILPFFAPRKIANWEETIAAHCNELALAVAKAGRGDAAIDYAQHIPVGAIAAILGLAPSDGDRFRTWIIDFVEKGVLDPPRRERAQEEIAAYMRTEIARRREDPADDLISHLVDAEIHGEPLDDDVIERILILQLVAGIDTTWSSIGAALWHLATHTDDRRRLVAEPELIPSAVEEFLRAYAPVHVARAVVEDTTIGEVEIQAGDSVLMSFPIACRDPEMFERPDDVILDREKNRHAAFGLGIHRCLGSNLARLEMRLAITAWLEHVPEFHLAPEAQVEWSRGQIRGPRTIPIEVGSD